MGTRPRPLRFAWALAPALAGPPSAIADTLWLSGGGLELRDVRVTRVEAGAIVFASNGREASRPAGAVSRLRMDGEPILSEAELLRGGARTAEAIDAYRRAARSARSEAARRWAWIRLIELGQRAGRLDLAVAAYLDLLHADPLAATLAPAVDAAGRGMLDDIAAAIDLDLRDRRWDDGARAAALDLLGAVHAARGEIDLAAAARAGRDELLARDPRNIAAREAVARSDLDATLEASTEPGRPTRVPEAALAEPATRAAALLALAEAQYAELGDAPDRAALDAAALAYLRVVAAARQTPDAASSSTALLRLAQLHERAGEFDAARRLAGDLLRDHPSEAAAGEARLLLSRLPNPAPPR